MRLSALFAILALLSVSPCIAAPDAAPTAAGLGADFDTNVRPLLQTYCYQCHGQDKEEGGVSYADVKSGTASLRHRAVWRRAAKQVKADKMPPEDGKEQLTPEDKQTLLAWLSAAGEFLDCSPKSRDPGPSLVRRLNRTEYDNTMRDLFYGLPFNSGEEIGMPADDVVDGYDTLATAMQLSATTLEKYMAGADRALDKVFGPSDAAATGNANAGSAPRGGRPGVRPGSPNAGKTKFDPQQSLDAIVFVRPGDKVSPKDAARQVLTKFMRRAYRRPVELPEVDRFLRLFDEAQAAGRSFEQSVRATLKPVLCSPNFLFRIERDRPAVPEHFGVPVGDHELAVRLSYFLWSTMPDDELASLADAGKLSEAKTLDAQVTRMLTDPRARALTDNFAAQWLQLRKLANARPTTEFFPTFTPKLRQAMYDEAATFFDHLRTDDRSVLDLLDANYTYINGELAKHYGIAGVGGTETQGVELKPEQHRGGLLGMAGVLSMTSHTFRTSPTQRGKYVLEVIFGTPPPPPPANAAANFKEDGGRKKKGEVKTFRDQLAAHATQKSCASCHAKIDPLGFALDNYDAIGAWRDSTTESPLDTSGVLPSGEKINGVAELKKVILDRKDDFTRNLAEQMLVYAIGRKSDYFDECTIREVTDGMRTNGYKFFSLVRGIVTSPTFRERRPAGAGI